MTDERTTRLPVSNDALPYIPAHVNKPDATRPAHYRGDGMEAMDVINAYGLGEGFRLGNVIKYITRYTRTGNPDDLRKARQYIDFELAAVVERQAADMDRRIAEMAR